MTTPNNTVWLVIYDNVVGAFTTEAKAREYKEVYFDNDSWIEIKEYQLDADPYADKADLEAAEAKSEAERPQRELDQLRAAHPELSIELKSEIAS